MNTELVQAALSATGRRLVVLDDGEIEDDLVRDITEVLASFCARLYGRRSAKNRARRASECRRTAGWWGGVNAMARNKSGLRPIREPFVVTPPKGVRTRTRVHLTSAPRPARTLVSRRILGLPTGIHRTAGLPAQPTHTRSGSQRRPPRRGRHRSTRQSHRHPQRLDFTLADCTARRDAQVRHVITRLIHLAAQHGCASIGIENLGFDEARNTGRRLPLGFR